jgi:hypothetical protein
MEVDNTDKYFSKFEIEFIDRFVKYISHCSIISHSKDILNDNRLQAKNYMFKEELFRHDKVFCKVQDIYLNIDNSYCYDLSVEYQLNKSLLTKHKYYFIHEPQEFGSTWKALYLSPYLFEMIKRSNFDKKEFRINLKKEKIEDPIVKIALLDEIPSLFESKIVKEKYNPPITSALIHAIDMRKKKGDPAYGMTVAFFGHIDLSKYLNHVIISNEINDVFYTYVQPFIDGLEKRNIPYTIKKFYLYRDYLNQQDIKNS